MVCGMSDEMNMVKVWQGGIADKTPLWLMRQAGRYLPEYRDLRAKAGGFLDLCFNPEFAAEVTLQPMRRFALDSAIIFSDILILPYALGVGLRFGAGEGPILDVVKSASVLRDVPDQKILSPVYDAISIVRAELEKDRALIGFAGSAFTVASYMIEGRGGHDFSGIKAMMRENTAEFNAIMDVLVEQTTQHLCGQIEAGVNAVQLFESWAGALEGAEFARYVLEPNKRIIAGVKAKYPNIPVIFFPRAASVDDLRACAGIGADCLGLSQDVSLDVAKELQNQVCVQGNLDPQILLLGGQAMKDAVEDICQNLAGRHFVFNLGHGVIKETPPEHVAQLVEWVHDWKIK